MNKIAFYKLNIFDYSCTPGFIHLVFLQSRVRMDPTTSFATYTKRARARFPFVLAPPCSGHDFHAMPVYCVCV